MPAAAPGGRHASGVDSRRTSSYLEKSCQMKEKAQAWAVQAKNPVDPPDAEASARMLHRIMGSPPC
jgi:hypothetical protein